jgi:polyisoprenoid-binding protein YceI
MRRRNLIILVAVALVAGGAFWFMGRDTPAAVDLDRALADAAAALESDGQGGGEGEGEAPEGGEAGTVTDASGRWVVDTSIVGFDSALGSGTWVGYRIDEELSGIGFYTAVGRSPRVEGEIVIEGRRVMTAEVRADLQGLVSDNANRDSRVRPLFVDRPVSFTLSVPVDFGAIPEEGQRVAVSAPGVLRVGDVARDVTVELSADVFGSRLVVTGSMVILLSDFDVSVPSAPVVLSVSDEATVELQLYLSRT